ncbi:hypothetical protein BSKO_09995 [Bryopsis sp. KO-2023]|nr:hypothetical protein BSKO_09995 [Bryopsis sp. KO-2023]
MFEEVKGVLASIGSTIHLAFVLPGISDDRFNDLEDLQRIEVDQHVMKKISGVESVDNLSIVAEIDLPWKDASLEHRKIKRLLGLEGIQDPGNLGTLIRTAVAFGWDGVFLLPGCCDPFNDKALRASRGGVFKIPLISGSWTEFRELVDVNKLECFAGQPKIEGQEMIKPNSEKPLCLILGSEGPGLSSASLQIAKPITIPMVGEMESLNVAVAGGVLMFLMRSSA